MVHSVRPCFTRFSDVRNRRMGHFFTALRIIRYAPFKRGIAACFAVVIALGAWGLGGEKLAALNPMAARERTSTKSPPLGVWVSSPAYANAPPKIFASATGTRITRDTITLPQGSIVRAHWTGQDEEAPELIVNGTSKKFTTGPHGDFSATEVLTQGSRLGVRRGWTTLASWNIRVLPDNPPHVSMTAPPVLSDDKKLRVAYDASDDFGIAAIALRVTPRDTLPGSNNAPVDIALPVPSSKRISRTDFEDIAAHPWAGRKVTLQIVATNETGKTGLSDAVDLTLPERSFVHPLARVLIEERAKLMQRPDDKMLREETANIMANIAHDPANFHGDPLILMALRSGAVRLVLGHDINAAISVNDLLWQTASRIEDGPTGATKRAIQDAGQDMADNCRFEEWADALRLPAIPPAYRKGTFPNVRGGRARHRAQPAKQPLELFSFQRNE